MLEREEVINAYRKLLGRDPESEETILSHISSCNNAELLHLIIMGSVEYGSNQSRNRPRSTSDDLKKFLPHSEINAELLTQDLSGQYGMYLIDSGLDDKLTSIIIDRPTGRFGNNFFQIANALIVAAALKVDELIIPEMQCASFTQKAHWHGVRLLTKGSTKPVQALVGDFYAPFGFETFFSPLPDRLASSACAQIGKSFYSHILEPVEEKKQRLGVHFRGGDIFARQGGVHRYYVQPPASYYIYAIEHALKTEEIDEILLVSEDRSNPSLGIVEGHFAGDKRLVNARRCSTEVDLMTLMQCKFIVSSYSSFVEAACILSQNLQSAYFFRTASSQDMYNPFLQSRVANILNFNGRVINVVEDGSVEYTAPRTWANTESQIEQMRTFPKDRLRLFKG